MTENEILKDLQNYQGILKAKTRINAGVNPEIALNAVTEAINIIEQYRAIGTVEELQKLKGVITDFPLDCGSPIKSIAEIWNQLKKYLAIGTIEEFKALKEKNTPKKIAYQIGKNGLKHEKCPTCGSFSVFGKHCTECGQAVDYD